MRRNWVANGWMRITSDMATVYASAGSAGARTPRSAWPRLAA